MKINRSNRTFAADDVRSLTSSGLPKEIRDSSPRLLPSERGIALVITLILLSVTLIMAVAFLAVSRRERGSVVTSTDTATARLAADAALANAEAQIFANVFSATNPNPYNYGLLVSTNYQNSYGYAPGSQNPTNVNYDYRSDGAPLNRDDFLQNVANLQYLPRVPVFVQTNALGSNEFRFYLDLNRNGKFEASGFETNYDNFGNVIKDGFGNATTNFQVGDPQWIGVLERPDAPHGPNNKFVSRYAFIALPADNALDLNAIHNQTLNSQSFVPAQDGYFRNQGVGTWEINLAAFLADLNNSVNEWGNDIGQTATYYRYNQPGGFNEGNAFADAFALLSYRYANNYNSLAPVGGTGGPNLLPGLFTNSTTSFPPFQNNVDAYSDWTLMTTPAGINVNNQKITVPWAGADNTNHYFSLMSDLFDPNKVEKNVTPPGFIERLERAGNTNSTYDRYTFYRMLAQLGTDSSPESGKMNLNYDNLDQRLFIRGNITTVLNNAAITNFMAWTPIAFFTNAADRMLRAYTTNWFQANPSNYLATYYGITNNYYYNYADGLGNTVVVTDDPSGLGLTNTPFFGMTNQIPAFGLTNIPVYINGQYVYSSAIQRVLQLAANIYDASTTNFFPSVFRPAFWVTNQFDYNRAAYYKNVYIQGFGEVTNISQVGAPLSEPYNLLNPAVLASLVQGPYYINVFGVPQIIGAKKGLPNFNQFAMQNTFEITRRLELTRSTTNAPLNTYKVNQKFSFGSATNFGVANQLKVECWNSYASNYTRSTDIYVTNWLTMNLTNDENFSTNFTFIQSGFTNVTKWPGYSNLQTASFLIPFNTNAPLVPANAVYRFNSGAPYLTTDPVQLGVFESNVVVNGSSYPQPHWWLIVTNNIQVAMVDHSTGRLIDYVQLSGPNSTRDIGGELSSPINSASSFWNTNYVQSLLTIQLPQGISSQLDDSKNYGGDSFSASGFKNFIYYGNDGKPYGNTNLTFQAYSPPTTLYQTTSWQANDPLVHYLATDLFDSANNTNAQTTAVSSIITPGATVVFPNERYQPWGISKQMLNRPNVDTNMFNFAFKDPLVWSSDHWDFPTNKFPTVGWLGRVHRGTPWQTVYLKASNVIKQTNGTNTWMNWTGNFNSGDAADAGPVQDRLLFDVFTTAVNDNATRGQLSVNVAANPNDMTAGLAAWSALFSGVTVLSNNLPDDVGKAATTLNTFHTKYPLLTIPKFDSFSVDPVGLNGASSPLWQVVTNINFARTNFANLDGAKNVFEHVGDILSAKQLTEQSPLLNWNDPSQQHYGISDEMYEWLPQQTMSLLRVSSAPRYVIYCYGQTLKPAPNGIVTSSAQFGMVTNYQVVAETATRAVVQFRPVITTDTSGTHTNYSATVEQFNPLPPD